MTPRRSAGAPLSLIASSDGTSNWQCERALAWHMGMSPVSGLSRAPRRLLPLDVEVAGCHARAACSTGASRAFERKIDALPQAGIENRLALAAVESEFAVLMLNRNLHCARTEAI